MEPGYRSPLLDFFRRGEVARDVRLLAAQGALAPRAHEQLALLILLADDPDPLIAATANTTLDALPADALSGFLARSDVPDQMRVFFKARGIDPALVPAGDAADALVGGADDAEAAAKGADPQVLSSLPVLDRMKLAMKGTREQRALLIRDSNKLVAAAVMTSPKLTEAEVESFARMGNVSEDVLRIISTNRTWMKNYGVIAGLVRNPKCPPAISMTLVQRLNDRDLKSLAVDRNVPEGVRLVARKFVVKAHGG
jgi:hypothetical protein